jgi:eukaryotic-like serine/threonine-protein kinase
MQQHKADSQPPTKCIVGADSHDSDGAAVDLGLANDRLLDLLAIWEERYVQGLELSAESLAVDDSALLQALKSQIEQQKRLRAFLKISPKAPLVAKSDEGAREGEDKDHDDLAREPPAVSSPPFPLPNVPVMIGRYRVARVLGQGGFGRVYLAHDPDLDRDVAIKMPIPGGAAKFLDIEAYLKEAQILARLAHPNIVPVYDVGRTEDGLFYIVSKYMDGGDLATRLRRDRPAFSESARLLAALCDALHYTHTQDLFHRDIKPGNILLDAAGAPSLADFGLALKDENVGQGARLVGTAAYMSPEQARGEGHLVDGRSDIFSMGIVFYELLTGRRPFRGSSHYEVMQQISSAEPRPPRQINDAIPQELERICLKALSKRASERYTTARDAAEDLRHFLRRASVTALKDDVTQIRTAMAVPDVSPAPASAPSDSSGRSIRIVPKGLCSFDEHDADFFLELLPGPRDRDGLPDVLRFWKSRIEATDQDRTFRVGLIYGPSGSGKSSLVKAGLLTRLGRHVVSVYVEATPGRTEQRLVRGLAKRFPDLPAATDLIGSLTMLRRGHGLPEGHKALLVLDQFEQWLFSHGGEVETELIAALRQCDGERLQALCLVRDDFWMAATRFMKDLEIELVPDRNIAAVDLFDQKHTRKVLAAYGRAYEALPAGRSELTKEQITFLDEAVIGLAQDGRVVPVRLALFAEMVKDKPWTPATLRDVHGMLGVGVRFLDDTFSSPRSNPNHRYHHKAAQAVLKSLLPETNADIKGGMRSIDELRAIAGHGDRTDDFADLLRILDTDLRLITPVDTESAVDEPPQSPVANGRYYQLTHDYLVHALREWLTRKQRETRSGRAELVLAERAALWNAKPENRFMPSAVEWANIRLLTKKTQWTELQRRMMKKAGRKYLIHMLGFILVSVLIGGAGIQAYGLMRASSLVESLASAETATVGNIIGQLSRYRWWAERPLRRMLMESNPESREYLHASLALLPGDRDQIAYLLQRLVTADPTQMGLLRDSLEPYRHMLIAPLWTELRRAKRGEKRILPLAGVLAGYDPANSSWSEVDDKVAEAMVRGKVDDLRGWRQALWNVRDLLIGSLAEIYRDESRLDEHSLAASVLTQYAANQPILLADLLLDSDAKSFDIIFPAIEAQRSATLAHLRSAVSFALTISTPAFSTDAVGRDQHSGADQELAKDRIASRGGRAGVALIRLGYSDEVWRLLEYSDDPRSRSAFIDALSTFRADPAILAAELRRLLMRTELGGAPPAAEANAFLFDPTCSRRRALIQALAAYPKEALTDREREQLVAALTNSYHSDPDAGVHSASELVLKRWFGRDRLVIQPERPPRAREPFQRRWYVNSQGQTMILVEGPVIFEMGSPASDPDHQEEEALHRRRIPRRFAIASNEVTVEEFQRFARAKFQSEHEYNKAYTPGRDGPMNQVSWFEVAPYCNWLSEQEGLPRCYEPDAKGNYAEGMRVNAEAVAAGGYRLPTEAEYEYACRAGTVTSRYYGHTLDLLGTYEWNVTNSGFRSHSCGSKLPNDLGLFDMLSNAMEWCHDRHLESLPDSKGITDDAIEDEIIKNDKRYLRSDRVSASPLNLRSAGRAWFDAWDRRSDTGFRVARTCP